MMTTKRTMTLNLTDAEMRALEELSGKKELTKTAVIRPSALSDNRSAGGEGRETGVRE